MAILKFVFKWSTLTTVLVLLLMAMSSLGGCALNKTTVGEWWYHEQWDTKGVDTNAPSAPKSVKSEMDK